MKIGIAQINTTVADFAGNRKRILDAYDQLVKQGADLVLYPELAVCGYPPQDLIFREGFIQENQRSVEAIASHTRDIPLLVGFAQSNPGPEGRHCFNAAAWCQNGSVKEVGRKCLLPTYDVFDEDRLFEPDHAPLILKYKGKKIGVSICEDLWHDPGVAGRYAYAENPVDNFLDSGVNLILNLSASPWYRNKGPIRESRFAEAAKRCGCPLVYVNFAGANDSLIFDGASIVFDGSGKVRFRDKPFQESCSVIDLDQLPEAPRPYLSVIEATYRALILGIRDYATKSHFKQAILGISGGIDSAILAVLAAEALGKDNIIGLQLPAKVSSDHGKEDAALLAKNLGLTLHNLPIQEGVDTLEHILAPLLKDSAPDITEENLQARVRGTLIMALSNKWNLLPLSTSNKSELAVGYSTLYGDMCGGLAPISDIYKTVVYELARFINKNKEVIPKRILEKAPSAELRPNQTDQDTLPDYEVLDAILERYIEGDASIQSIKDDGFDPKIVEQVCHWVDKNEYKRRQAPVGLKATSKMLNCGRHVPVVMHHHHSNKTA